MKPFVGAGLLVSLVGFVTGCGGAPEPPASSETAVARIQTAAPARAVPVTAGWTVADGISTPESAYFDPDSGFIFTSQIVGQPDARDGNGRIAKLNGDGTVIAADWVTGLNAPKGLRSHQGTLWVADLGEAVSEGLAVARAGVPGPVFIECPVDLLYEEATILQWYQDAAGKGTSLADRVLRFYLKRHAARLFAGSRESHEPAVREVSPPVAGERAIARASDALARAGRPLMVIGSQSLTQATNAARLASAP